MCLCTHMRPDNCSTSTTITTHASRMNWRKLQFVSRWDRQSTSANLSIFSVWHAKRRNRKQNKTKEIKAQKKERKKRTENDSAKQQQQQQQQQQKHADRALQQQLWFKHQITDCIQIAFNNDCCSTYPKCKTFNNPIHPYIHTYIQSRSSSLPNP